MKNKKETSMYEKNVKLVMNPCTCPCGCNSTSTEEICPDCKNGECLDARE